MYTSVGNKADAGQVAMDSWVVAQSMALTVLSSGRKKGSCCCWQELATVW